MISGKANVLAIAWYTNLKTPTNIILVTIYSKLDQADISAEQIRRILTRV